MKKFLSIIMGLALTIIGLAACSSNPTPKPDVRIPANAWDLYSTEFAAFQKDCGAQLSRSSLAAPAADDATDFVLKGEGKAVASLGTYRCIIATNPTVGDMLIRGLQNVKVPSGETVGGLNPWITEFIKSSSDDLMNWVEKDKSGTLFVSNEYQKKAFLVWTLLNRLKYEGEQTGVALRHYPLQATQAGGLPYTVKSDTPYKGEFVRLVYTQKGQECPFWVIGINTSDGRLAFLGNVCGERGAPSPATTSSPAPSSPPVTTTPRPTPTPTRPPATLEPKDPSKLLNPPVEHKPAPAPAPEKAEKSAPPAPTKPANPSTKPTAPAPGVPAPGSTPTPRPSQPAPTPTQAPAPSDPGTHIPDPGAPPG